MADITIDDAVRDTEVTGAELFPASDGGSPKAVAAAKVKDYVLAQIAALTAADAVDAASDKVYVLKGGALKPVPASVLAAAVLDYAFALTAIANLNGNETLAVKDANGKKSMTLSQLKEWVSDGLVATSSLTALAATVDGKVDKVTGKALSTNDYSNEEKAKLAALVSNVQGDWSVTDSSQPSFIKNKPTIPQGVTVDHALDDQSQNAIANDVVTLRIEAMENDIEDMQDAFEPDDTFDLNSSSPNPISHRAIAAEIVTLNGDIADKVDKVEGKGLSANDLTDARKNDVDARIANGVTQITELIELPDNGVSGYPPGALLVWNAEGVRYLYVNVGTLASCAFRRVALIPDEDIDSDRET